MILPSETRRKTILFAIAGILLAWAVVGGILLPAREKAEALDRKLREAKRDLQQMKEMADRYIDLSARLPQGMREETAGTPLLAEAESLSRRLGIEKNIKQMAPSSPGPGRRGEELSVNIANIPYPMFIDFLQGIYESPSAIAVRRAKISTSFANRGQVNVELVLAKGM